MQEHLTQHVTSCCPPLHMLSMLSVALTIIATVRNRALRLSGNSLRPAQ